MTSANVVGYQNVPTVSGFQFITPTFEKIDGSALTLGDVIPSGADAGWGAEHITIFDSELYIAAAYTYYCEDMGMSDGAGWYNDEDSSFANAVSLGGFGRGVQIETQGSVVQFSGAVTSGTVSIPELNSGFVHICNPTPVAQSIQNFAVVGVDAGWGAEHITIYDEQLYISGAFTYYCEDMGMSDGAGWYSDEDTSFATKAFEPSEGFIFESQGGVSIELPAVL